MFTCPPAIKSYLCNFYNIHNIPIFGAKSVANLDMLVQNFKRFFTGDVYHYVKKSPYSGQLLTTSETIQNHHRLHISLDKTKIKKLQTKISKAQNEHKRIIDSMDEWTKVKRNLGQELESKMKEVKFETSIDYFCKYRLYMALILSYFDTNLNASLLGEVLKSTN